MNFLIDYIGYGLVFYGFFLTIFVIWAPTQGERDPVVPVIMAAIYATVWPLGLLSVAWHYSARLYLKLRGR
jgi:hypothetical protein